MSAPQPIVELLGAIRDAESAARQALFRVIRDMPDFDLGAVSLGGKAVAVQFSAVREAGTWGPEYYSLHAQRSKLQTIISTASGAQVAYNELLSLADGKPSRDRFSLHPKVRAYLWAALTGLTDQQAA